jgi:hypothetical protein
MRRFLNACGWMVVLYATTNIALCADWGTLKGKFVLPRKPLWEDDQLLVAPDLGVGDVAIWLRTKDVAIHPDAAESMKAGASLSFKVGFVDPHVLPAQVGQVVTLKNRDARVHNATIAFVNNQPLNKIVHAQEEFSFTPSGPEAIPERIDDISDPMIRGWIMVCRNPYFAVSDSKGNFEIKNVPAGVPLEFCIWQEKLGLVLKVEIDGKAVDCPKGRFPMNLQPGENDLGNVTFTAAQNGIPR